ncbi:MAG: tetratricopeptide repeat protein [Bacteroidales bacterium]|nr:tetratricopeptide repeat protein [Bacteroidales bacterium]
MNKDSVLSITSKLTTFLLFLLTLIWIIKHLYHFDIVQPHGYILGDWLINYTDGGFKRRGLSGSLFFFLQHLTGLKLQILVFISNTFFILILFWFFIKILIKKELNIFFLTLFFSPLTFLFYFNDIGAVGRKEILVLALFAYFMYLLYEQKLSKKSEFVICCLIFVSAFFHEIIFFYIPYFLFALYYFNKRIEIKRYLFYIIPSLIAILLFKLFGTDLNAGKSLGILMEKGVTFIPFGVGVFWFNVYPNLFNIFEFYKEMSGAYLLYILSFSIGLVHFFSYLFLSERKQFKVFLLFFLVAIVFSSPLFYNAIDWGRWIHIHFMLLLILLSSILPMQETVKNLTQNIFSTKKQLFFLLIIPLMLLWRMPHCCEPGFMFNNFEKTEIPNQFSNEQLNSTREFSPEYYLNKSVEFYNLKMYDKTIEACIEAIKIKPDYAPAYFNICCSFIGLEKWDAAIETCDKALQIDPSLEPAKINKTWAIEQKQKFPIVPTYEYYLNLSLDFYNILLYDKCIESCNMALILKPDYAEAHFNKCCAYIGLEQWDNAITNCQNALNIKPDFEAAKINLNWALEQKNKAE